MLALSVCLSVCLSVPPSAPKSASKWDLVACDVLVCLRRLLIEVADAEHVQDAREKQDI